MSSLYNSLYHTIDWENGVTPWDVVALAIEHGHTPWYDPRFIQGYHQLLFDCFQLTTHWIKGLYYAQFVLEHMPQGIDDDLRTIAAALAAGRLPQTDTWNAGNPYTCSWPAPLAQYTSPWNGLMVRWTMVDNTHKRLARRLKLKTSGYQSPRRDMYTA